MRLLIVSRVDVVSLFAFSFFLCLLPLALGREVVGTASLDRNSPHVSDAPILRRIARSWRETPS